MVVAIAPVVVVGPVAEVVVVPEIGAHAAISSKLASTGDRMPARVRPGVTFDRAIKIPD
jgi:hypothetical protein